MVTASDITEKNAETESALSHSELSAAYIELRHQLEERQEQIDKKHKLIQHQKARIKVLEEQLRFKSERKVRG